MEKSLEEMSVEELIKEGKKYAPEYCHKGFDSLGEYITDEKFKQPLELVVDVVKSLREGKSYEEIYEDFNSRSTDSVKDLYALMDCTDLAPDFAKYVAEREEDQQIKSYIERKAEDTKNRYKEINEKIIRDKINNPKDVSDMSYEELVAEGEVLVPSYCKKNFDDLAKFAEGKNGKEILGVAIGTLRRLDRRDSYEEIYKEFVSKSGGEYENLATLASLSETTTNFVKYAAEQEEFKSNKDYLINHADIAARNILKDKKTAERNAIDVSDKLDDFSLGRNEISFELMSQYLIDARKNGRNEYIEFNGEKIYSDNVTYENTYLKCSKMSRSKYYDENTRDEVRDNFKKYIQLKEEAEEKIKYEDIGDLYDSPADEDEKYINEQFKRMLNGESIERQEIDERLSLGTKGFDTPQEYARYRTLKDKLDSMSSFKENFYRLEKVTIPENKDKIMEEYKECIKNGMLDLNEMKVTIDAMEKLSNGMNKNEVKQYVDDRFPEGSNNTKSLLNSFIQKYHEKGEEYIRDTIIPEDYNKENIEPEKEILISEIGDKKEKKDKLEEEITESKKEYETLVAELEQYKEEDRNSKNEIESLDDKTDIGE